MNDPRGSLWRKWDLHFHTPRSYDYRNRGLGAADLVNALISQNVEVVAVTDHHVLDPKIILDMRSASAGKLTVLPGIELASNLGGDEGVHFIAIFSEEADPAYLATELASKLGLTQSRHNNVSEERLYVNFTIAASVIQEMGGLITIHGHGKAANYETISSKLKFKQQQKTDLLRNYIDLIEIGGPPQIETYRDKIFPLAIL